MIEMTPLEAAEKLEKLLFFWKNTCQKNDVALNYIKAVKLAASLCRKIAAGKYKPAIHAAWREDTDPADGDLRCTYCGAAWSICVQKDLGHVGAEEWKKIFPYCSLCGAKMDGKEKTDDRD